MLGIFFLATFATLWTKQYRESIGKAGLNYIFLGIGVIIGTQSTACVSDTIYRVLKERSGKAVGRPEFRLPLLVPAAILTPAGLLWYGWSAQEHLHWIIPNIGMAMFGRDEDRNPVYPDVRDRHIPFVCRIRQCCYVVGWIWLPSVRPFHV